jgi:hypothetical protein
MSWNKETSTVNMHFGDYFHAEDYPLGPNTMSDMVREIVMEGQVGVARELLLITLNKVDWDELADAYNEQLVDEL